MSDSGTADGIGRGTSDPLVLLALGLLLERPMTSADLAQVARERAQESPFGGPAPSAAEFAAVATLLRHAALTRGHPDHNGEAHALTERGRAGFTHRVRAMLGTPEERQPDFHTAVGYLGALDRRTAVDGLRARAELLRERAARIEAAPAGGDGVPRLFRIENEYAVWMCRAELDWIEETLEEIGTGALIWPHIEVTENGWEWHTDAP